MARSYVQNVSRLRRKLRRMPAEITKEVKDAIRDGVNLAERSIVQEIPRSDVDHEHLADNFKSRISKRDGLSAELGYANKPGFRREWHAAGWRAHFVIFGTRSSRTKPLALGTQRNPGGLGPKKLRNRAGRGLAPNNFMSRGWKKVEQQIIHRIKSGVDRALKRAADL